jgi:hypothetical protein
MRPGLCSGEGDIAIPQHDRSLLAHQQIGEQCARQEDREEIHQADEDFLGLEVHGVVPLNLAYSTSSLSLSKDHRH